MLLSTESNQTTTATLSASFRRIALTPWGVGNGPLTLGLHGQRAEPAGVYMLGNGYRCYSSHLMRFTRSDRLSPFGAGGLNAYAFCAADPLNRTDRNGGTWWNTLKSLLGWGTQKASADLNYAVLGNPVISREVNRYLDYADILAFGQATIFTEGATTSRYIEAMPRIGRAAWASRSLEPGLRLEAAHAYADWGRMWAQLKDPYARLTKEAFRSRVEDMVGQASIPPSISQKSADFMSARVTSSIRPERLPTRTSAERLAYFEGVLNSEFAAHPSLRHDAYVAFDLNHWGRGRAANDRITGHFNNIELWMNRRDLPY